MYCHTLKPEFVLAYIGGTVEAINQQKKVLNKHTDKILRN